MQDIYQQLGNSCSSILNTSRWRHALADDAVEITYFNTSWIKRIAFSSRAFIIAMLHVSVAKNTRGVTNV